MRFSSLLLVLSLLGHGGRADAQYQARSWLSWYTIQAGRFAIHFSAELEPWARTVAGKINGIDTTVSGLVGYEPTQRIDVIIDDPFRVPNGSAWPLLDAPRLVLWATPPNPREDIGTFVSWADMLATHEFAHLAHLLRPTRNPLQSLFWKLTPADLGPLSRKSPRWMIEGYATYIEGRVTGSGRPNGVWRSTLLRQWALEGVLPTYGQLNTMGGMYGGEFAYLSGSSFIEWLVARRGDSSLVSLWRRMSARNDRGFVEAFTGVYGETPEILYGRFAAELTAAAKQREAELHRASADTGVTIQHLSRETGDPAISRDGGRAAIVLASATRPGRVVIWRTIPEPDTLAGRAAKALLERDPEDVPAFRPYPPPKKPLATLYAVGNQPYQDPRFFSDGRVLVWRNTAIGNGAWAPDLYVWDPQRSGVRRLTRRANVRQGDPSPDGKTIAATRCAAGKCDLAVVDVASGSVTVVSEGNDTRSFYRPRFSRNGETVAVSVHDDGYWRIGLFDVARRSLRIVTSDARSYFDVAFADDSTLVAAADENGLLNIVRLRMDGTVLGRVSNVIGGAVAPEVNPADGSTWFLSLHARGWDVRSTSGVSLPLAAPETGATPHALPTAEAPPSRRYSPDRKWAYFPIFNVVDEGGNVGLGLSNVDPVGKRELLLQSTFRTSGPAGPNAGWKGISGILTFRGRINTFVAGFGAEQPWLISRWIRGGAVGGELTHRVERYGARALFSASGGSIKTDLLTGGQRDSYKSFFTDLSASRTRQRDLTRTTLQLQAQASYETIGGGSARRVLATGILANVAPSFTFTAQRGISDGNSPEQQFVLGGQPASLFPPGVLSQLVAMPGLANIAVGKRIETYRLSIPVAGARIYSWLGRAYAGAAPRLEMVNGIEWSQSIARVSLLGTPAGRITGGIGRTGDSGVDGHYQLYVTTQFGDWPR